MAGQGVTTSMMCPCLPSKGDGGGAQSSLLQPRRQAGLGSVHTAACAQCQDFCTCGVPEFSHKANCRNSSHDYRSTTTDSTTDLKLAKTSPKMPKEVRDIKEVCITPIPSLSGVSSRCRTIKTDCSFSSSSKSAGGKMPLVSCVEEILRARSSNGVKKKLDS